MTAALEESAPAAALRDFAMSFPEAEAGTSCVKRAFRVRKKAYVYIGMKKEGYNVMVKLRDSLAAASALQAEQPDRFQVGAHGWTTVRLPHDDLGPPGLLEGWIDESYRLLAHRSLVAML